MFDRYDAKEYDRSRHFKRIFLRAPDIVLTGAIIDVSEDNLVTVVDSEGRRGEFQCGDQIRVKAVLAEIDRGIRAEAMHACFAAERR
jgi:hypothetical protein